MKAITLPSAILEFTSFVIDSFMEENGVAPLSQKGYWFPPIQKKFKIFPASSYKIQKKFVFPQKNICG